jgi:triosephosphate isomerase
MAKSERRPLVAANWKMNGTLRSVRALLDGVIAGLEDYGAAEVALCPPCVYLAEVADRLRGASILLGAQDLSEHEAGAYTGEISAAMLKDYNCRFVIVGHSERRAHQGETDARVAAKWVAARRAGLIPILCVGETLAERERGLTEEVIGRQLDAVIAAAGIEAMADTVIAYEPVWAIGTGHTATPEAAQAAQGFLRARLGARAPGVAARIRILYGGSVKPANAASLFAMPDIDGGLIGGASLQAEEFLAICRAVPEG